MVHSRRVVVRDPEGRRAAVLEINRDITVSAAIHAAGHKLTIKLPSSPVYLEADPERFCQAIVNLLGNAVKYTHPPGRVRLHATVEMRDGPTTGRRTRTASRVRISISDSGIGIAPDLLPRIFDLFTQGDRSIERVRGGLGVGLTLVKSLVQMHGGTIEAYSDGPGRGSEFVVFLPVVAPPSDLPEPDPPEVEEAIVPPRRVLVVDDNRDAAESLRMLLELMGHTVRVAHDGPTALGSAGLFKPQVSIVDIGMPGMSGYEMARRLRAVPALAGGLLVALTGYGTEDDRKRSLEAGSTTIS